MIAAAFIAAVVAAVAFSWLFVYWTFPEPVEVGDVASNRLLAEVRGGRS